MQSWSCFFTQPRGAEKTLEKQARGRRSKKGLGVNPKVVVRTRDELAAVIEANPFP